MCVCVWATLPDLNKMDGWVDGWMDGWMDGMPWGHQPFVLGVCLTSWKLSFPGSDVLFCWILSHSCKFNSGDFRSKFCIPWVGRGCPNVVIFKQKPLPQLLDVKLLHTMDNNNVYFHLRKTYAKKLRNSVTHITTCYFLRTYSVGLIIDYNNYWPSLRYRMLCYHEFEWC